MKFTKKAYSDLLEKLIHNGYNLVDYSDECVDTSKKFCLLRHDVDMNMKHALEIAKIEQEHGCQSTFFVLLCTGFYNVFDKEIKKLLDGIIQCGCKIGLHFDETKYPELEYMDEDEYKKKISEYILSECEILGKAVGYRIDSVSMHRPSKRLLNDNIEIPGIINSYSEQYFHQYKYVSDSRRHWREDVENLIDIGTHKLYILTHPIWYEDIESDMKTTLLNFCHEAKIDRYNFLKDNIRDLEEELKEEDL